MIASLSSGSSAESIPSLRRSPGRGQINKIPLRKNSNGSIEQQPITNKSNTSQTPKSKSTLTRDCRRMLRTASREYIGSSSEELSTQPVKIEPPRRTRRIKVVSEAPKIKETSSRRSRNGSSRRNEDNGTNLKKVYTHKVRRVDDISKSSARKAQTSNSKVQSSSTRSS